MFDLERELDAVRTKLSASGISYALCGGLAVGVYGGILEENCNGTVARYGSYRRRA